LARRGTGLIARPHMDRYILRQSLKAGPTLSVGLSGLDCFRIP
jgi:hypothetical protein